MTTRPFTILENGQTLEVDALLEGQASDARIRVPAARLLDAMGWTQKSEGLCQGDRCIPIAHRADLITKDGVDLADLAEVMGRPLAIDRDEAVASIGAETDSHASQLASGFAPDFTLPDLSGKEYSLSSFKGKKVLLIAYASW